MSFRGRGRGRFGGGRGFGGGFRPSKKQPYILFPEDVTLPSLPNIDNMSNEEKMLIRSKLKLEHFWVGSCYHLELEAFPKHKGRNGKTAAVPKSKKEDEEIERYSDRFKQRTFAKREALGSYLKQIPTNFPSELIQGIKRSERATKKLRWDRNLGEVFAKLERFQDKTKNDEDEDEDEEELQEEEEEDTDDDYNEPDQYDDDEDDYNRDEEPADEDEDDYI